MNSCIMIELNKKYGLNSQSKTILKKRNRNEKQLIDKHFRGIKLSIRKDIIQRFKEGESVKEVMEVYPDIKRRSMFNMKGNPIKYSLPENDIK